MLRTVCPETALPQGKFDSRAEELKEKLPVLQQKIRSAGLPVIILFEGWGASGKGSRIADLIANWDPRGYKVYSITGPDCEEKRFPPMRRYWLKTPEQGQIAVFDRSWYQDVTYDYAEKRISAEERRKRLRDIAVFEQTLTDSGCLIIKFFLHISAKEQKKRLDRLRSGKSTAWRVTKEDLKRNRQYDKYYALFDKTLDETHFGYAPWHPVPAKSRKYAAAAVFETVISRTEQALALLNEKVENTSVRDSTSVPAVPPHPAGALSLDGADLTLCTPDSIYRDELEKERKKLAELHNQLYLKKIPAAICFEGWDAAGKGGSIKRLSGSLDPRGCEVIPIAAPSPVEKKHHYLWRFWNALPKTGHIAIFDRTWYGRCLVERVEGLCTAEEWMRSWQEINEFEQYLRRHGCLIVKFWIHIDKDEQLRRFEERERTPEKRWKITDEDWRNREKWEQYETAVSDMLAFTSTDAAPWTVVAGNDKNSARITVLKTTAAAFRKRLRQEKPPAHTGRPH